MSKASVADRSGRWNEIADAYWRHRELSTGTREQRLAATAVFWSVEQVAETVDADPAEALRLLDTILSHPAAEPAIVGAGPLEDLLAACAPGVDVAVAERARASATWRAALGAVWLDDREIAALPALRTYLQGSNPH